MKKEIEYGGIIWEVTKYNGYYEIILGEENIVDYLSEETFNEITRKYD